MRKLQRTEAERLLQALSGLGKVQSLYPEGHVVEARARQGFTEVLQEMLRGGDTLLMGSSEGHLVVGEVPFIGMTGSAKDVEEWFDARDVEGVTLYPGVSAEEAARFCRWLRGKEPETWAGDKIKLTQLAKEKEAWKKGLRAYHSAVGAVEEVYEALMQGRTPAAEAGRRSVRDLTALLEESPSVVQGLSLIKDYDRYTFNHSVNVCVLALRIGHQWQLSPWELEILGVGGLFHDIGKTRTPAEVVRKAGPLTSEEWECMKQHPVHGKQLIGQMNPVPRESALLVYEHHMHHDGGGYPHRPPGYRVQPMSAVITAADVFDAMTSHRSYNRPLSLPGAVQELGNLRGKMLDPAVVDILLAVLGPLPLGTLVRLATGEVGVIVGVSDKDGSLSVRVVRTKTGEDIAPGEGPILRVSSPQGLHAVDPLLYSVDPVEVLRHGS